MNQWSVDFLEKVINDYGKALVERSLSGCTSIGLETELPFPKDVIRLAIAQILLTQDIDEEFRKNLEFGYIELESFLPAKEYEILKPFYTATSYAEKTTRSGESKVKEDWVKADQIIENTAKATDGKLFSEIQERMRTRFDQRTREIETLRSIRGLPSIEES